MQPFGRSPITASDITDFVAGLDGSLFSNEIDQRFNGFFGSFFACFSKTMMEVISPKLSLSGIEGVIVFGYRFAILGFVRNDHVFYFTRLCTLLGRSY